MEQTGRGRNRQQERWNMNKEQDSIIVRRHGTRRYEAQDIVLLPNNPPAEIRAQCYILAEIENTREIQEILSKHRLRKGERCARTAQFAIRTRQGAKLLLPGVYRIKAIQSVVWGFSCVVRFITIYHLRIIAPEAAPPTNELAFDYDGNMVEPWDAAQWFYEAARG